MEQRNDTLITFMNQRDEAEFIALDKVLNKDSAVTTREQRRKKMETFNVFLMRHRISLTEIERRSSVTRRTIRRWLNGESTPREDCIELVLDALSNIINTPLTAKEVGLA